MLAFIHQQFEWGKKSNSDADSKLTK